MQVPAPQRRQNQTGAAALKFLRPFLAIYGTGIAGTFGWLFFTLSGAAACTVSQASCKLVFGLTGQLALVWPAYWGGRLSGNPTVTPLVPIEVVVVAVLVFFTVLTLAKAYTMAERTEEHGKSRSEPLIKTSEPNRRNQSRAAGLVRSSRS